MSSAFHDSVLEAIVIDDRADFASRVRFPGAAPLADRRRPTGA